MNEHNTNRGIVSETPKHPSSLDLEQLAEGTLPASEALVVRGHVESCRPCSRDFDACVNLATLMEQLPRFAPSVGFADGVMARVSTAPVVNPVIAFLRRLIPATRHGWTIVATVTIAPATVLLAIVGAMLIQPLVTPSLLWQWFMMRIQAIGQGTLAWLADRLYGPEAWNMVAAAYSALDSVPVAALIGLAITVALGVPISAWGLVKLTRTPSVGVTYAN